jgi:carbamoyltransferase
LFSFPPPHSLGLLYSAFTAFLGFQVKKGEHKVRSMAPYGKPKYIDKIYDNLIKVAPDGSFWINMDYFSYHYSDEKTINSKFGKLFGKPRMPEMHFSTSNTRFPSYFGNKPPNYEELCRKNEYYADVAPSIQKVTEEILLKLANSLHKETGLTKLCIAGGVGLISLANSLILRETPFKDLFVQPAAGEGGGAMGAALHVYHGLMGNLRAFVLENA